jgi:uncharacterized protein YndB with AHSA1/START domain
VEAASELETIDAGGRYERRVHLRAPRERAFDAVATMTGLRSWWTPIVDGATTTGEELRFGFRGLDESIIMRVETARRPDAVEWLCVTHSSCEPWNGTRLMFELVEAAPSGCELIFRHQGLAPEVVERGWERFLTSLVSYVENGRGAPYDGDDERTERGNDDD